MTIPTPWTPDRLALLAEGWSGGLASTEIARTLGLTASAVRSKRRKLGLTPRSQQAREIANEVLGLVLVGARPPNPLQTPPNAPALPDPLVGSTPRPWTQREAGECAWPVRGWGDETASCCLPVECRRSPYCPGHMALMRREAYPPADPGNVTLFRGAR